MDVSRVGLFFRGEVGRNFRLGDRGGAFTSASGVVHPVHSLTRGDVALYAGEGAVGLVAVAPGHQHRGLFSRP